MQKKILRTTALLLCFCILLLAVPNTFARDGKKESRFESSESSESRFFFVNPGELMTNVLFFLGHHFDLQTDRTGTPPDKNTTNGMKKLTAGQGSVALVKDD